MGLGNLRTSALKSMAVFACIIMTTSHSDAEVLPSSVSPIFDVACTAPFEDPQRFRNALPNAHIVEHLVTDIGNQPGRAKTVLSLNGLNTEIQALFPGDLLRRVTVEVSDSKPRSSISVDSTCQFTEAREIVYDTEDRIQSIRVYASDLNVSGSKSELLANLVKEVCGTTYLSGPSGKDYLDLNYFNHINVEYFKPNVDHYYSTLQDLCG